MAENQTMTNSAFMPGKDYVGVGVGGVILDERQRVLLLLRLKDPEAGFWCLPGGKVELFESRAAAILRETQEEVGLSCSLVREIRTFEHILASPPAHWVTSVFLLQVSRGQTPHNCEPEKHADMRWFSLASLPDKLAYPARIALEAYAQDPSFLSPQERLAS